MRVSGLETSFPAGCNTIMQAVTAKGQTPASNSPSDIATAISNIPTGVDLSVLSKSNYTESEFLNSVCKRDWFDYNFVDTFIKKTVTLTNSQQDGSKSMDWVIIDYNHDGSSYTFDLWASKAMFNNKKFNYSANNSDSNYYNSSNCNARITIESAISGFSSELQARLQDMTIASNGTNLTAKIKILSLTEMNIIGDYYLTEGNAYDKYFTTTRQTMNTYADLIRRISSGYACNYWTRSRYTRTITHISFISDSGFVGNMTCTDSYALIPVIRISVG